MRVLDYEVMAHAFAAQRELGRLCDERIYQADLAARLAAAGLTTAREVPIAIVFRDFTTTRDIDLIVDDKAIYELKTVAQLTSGHEAQILNYLVLTGSTRGKLVNFRPASVESRFVNTALDHAARRTFRVDTSRWQGPSLLGEAARELVADWGTSLEASLYQEALVHVCGGDEQITRQLPLRRGANELGRQRFHLCTPREAFGITCFEPEMLPAYEAQLNRLLQFSPLRAYQWINIAHHHLHFVTLGNSNQTIWQEDLGPARFPALSVGRIFRPLGWMNRSRAKPRQASLSRSRSL